MSSQTATGVTAEAVRELVAEMSPFGVTDVTPDTILAEELGFDSLGVVELVVVIGQRLDLPPLDEGATAPIERVADLECIIAEALQGPLSG